MNRTVVLLLAGCTTVALLASCRIETETTHQGSAQATDTTAARPEPSPDSLLALLLPLQNAVYLSPADQQAREALVSAAFDSASGSLYAVGKGVASPEAPEATARQGQSRAAQSDANRWVLYDRAWIAGDTRDFGAEITGEITYSATLLEHTEDDTLYVLVQVPYGSVTVR